MPINNKNPVKKSKEYKGNVIEKPRKTLTIERGEPDRVSLSYRNKIQVKKWESDVEVFFAYSSDVGRYDAEETVDEAVERVTKVVTKKMKEEVSLIMQQKKKLKRS